MSSIAYSLYDDAKTREKCYSCPDSGSGSVKVRGKNAQLECRRFTEIGNAMETRLTAMKTDIFQANLIDIVPIGVDTARMTWGKVFKFKTQSRGGGGISKYDCATDYQIPEMIRHDKLGYTELCYVHYKGCPKKLINTELQEMVFKNNAFSDAYDTNNSLSDALLMAARNTVSETVQYVDIIGVFGSADEKANQYDGILAQAYWAYTSYAYFHTIEYTVDETELITGTYVHAKYAGLTIDIQFDSTQDSDPDLNRYKTRAEVYAALVNWLNNEVTTASGRKYVDATYINNKIIVASKWTEATVNLQFFVDSNETVESWASCEKYTGVSANTLQGAMPIDERPILVEYKKYTEDNIIKELPRDIHAAQMEIDTTLMEPGQNLALYIDSYLWKTYRNALKIKDQDATAYDLSQDFEVYELDALSQHGGTGIWFLTVASSNRSLRNIAHLIDIERPNRDDIFIGFIDNTCREIALLYEILHGVMVKDFRLFASNLLNSPFARNLKEPYEKTVKMIPCYNKAVRSSYMDPSTGDCSITAQFEITDEYRNSALYYLDGVIQTLEDGETLPNGAMAVYEIQFTDKTLGIPSALLGTATFEYYVTAQDGMDYYLTGQNPILQYIGSASGVTFNVTQTVTLTNGCSSTFDASEHYEEDYPFEMRGDCNALDIQLDVRIDEKVLNYTITPTFQGSGTTPVVTSKGTINISAGADAAAAAEEIQQWLDDTPGVAGTATESGGVITVVSKSAVFQTFNAVAFTANTGTQLTIVDNTAYDSGDGLASFEVFEYEIGGSASGSPEYSGTSAEELPSAEVIDDETATGWTLDVNITTKMGCSFSLTKNVAWTDGSTVTASVTISDEDAA